MQPAGLLLSHAVGAFSQDKSTERDHSSVLLTSGLSCRPARALQSSYSKALSASWCSLYPGISPYPSLAASQLPLLHFDNLHRWTVQLYFVKTNITQFLFPFMSGVHKDTVTQPRSSRELESRNNARLRVVRVEQIHCTEMNSEPLLLSSSRLVLLRI